MKYNSLDTKIIKELFDKEIVDLFLIYESTRVNPAELIISCSKLSQKGLITYTATQAQRTPDFFERVVRQRHQLLHITKEWDLVPSWAVKDIRRENNTLDHSLK